MKCYYCCHRKGEWVVKVDRTSVVLCESCVSRNMTMRSLSLKFDRSGTPVIQLPQNLFHSEKERSAEPS